MSILGRIGKVVGGGADVLVTGATLGTVDTDFQEGDFTPGQGWTTQHAGRTTGRVVSGALGVASGGAHAVGDAAGFVKDLATMPFDDKNDHGFFNGIYHSATKRGGAIINHTMGPNYGLGAISRSVPAGVRHYAATPINEVMEGANWATQNLVTRPATTLLYGLSLPNSKSYQQQEGYDPKKHGNQTFSLLWSKQTWRDARGMAVDGKLETGERSPLSVVKEIETGNKNAGSSPGQAVALLWKTQDVLSDDEVLKAVNSDSYQTMSGIVDAGLQWESGTLAGKAIKFGKVKAIEAAQGGKLFTTIATSEDLERFGNSQQRLRFMSSIEKKIKVEDAKGGGSTVGAIRENYFSKTTDGDEVAQILVDAHRKGGIDGMDDAMRGLTGDYAARERLLEKQADIAGQIERKMALRNQTYGHGDPGVFDNPAVVDAGNAELNALYQELDHTTRAINQIGALADNAPRVTAAGNIRRSVINSDFYQKSPYAKPLQVMTQMNPQHIVRFERPDSDVQIKRMLDKGFLDQDTKNAFRSHYISAENAGDRAVRFAAIQEKTLQSIFDHYGVDENTAAEAVARARDGLLRGKNSFDSIASRAYDTGKGRVRMEFEDEAGNLTHSYVPNWVTQEANTGLVLPFDRIRAQTRLFAKMASRELDVGEIRKTLQIGEDEFGNALSGKGKLKLNAKRAAKNAQNVTAKHNLLANSVEFLDALDHIWRPSVLIRGAWPIRIVADEQLRILGKISGAQYLMAHGRNIKSGAMDISDTALNAMKNIRRRWEGLAPEPHTPRIPGSNNAFEYRGYGMSTAFGAPGDKANILRDELGAGGIFRQEVRDSERASVSQMRKIAEDYRTILPTDRVNYAEAWSKAVNFQIAQDPLGRMMIRGKPVDEIMTWLRKDPKGIAYARQRGWRTPEYVQENLESLYDQVARYIPDDPELKKKVLAHNADISDLERTLGKDRAQWPAVHGGVLDESLGKGVSAHWNKFVEKSMDLLGRLPSEKLSRNPFYDVRYRTHAKQLVDLAEETTGGRLTQEVLDQVQDMARKKATHDVRDLLYDQAERSALSQHLRFLIPFFEAWKEVMTKWAGIMYENPTYAIHLHQIWTAPEKAGIVTDEHGNYIDGDGNGHDAFGNPVSKDKLGSQRNINIPIAKWTTRLPFVGGGLAVARGQSGKGRVTFNKRSFNMALQLPGASWLVQVPLNQIAKDVPSIQDSIKWALPFGVTNDVTDMLLPAWGKRARAFSDEDGINQRKVAIRLYYDSVVDEANGKGKALTFAEANEKARDFMKMRIFASFLSPAAPRFVSPYQPWIDAYRNAQSSTRDNPYALGKNADGSPLSADDWFITQFGEEYFAAVGAISKSLDGIPPTIEGVEAKKKYQGLINQLGINDTPELAGLVVGSEGAGEFSSAAYESQFSNETSPGSGINERMVPGLQQSAESLQSRQGWYTFTRSMDALEAIRIQRGLSSMNVKGAEDLQAAKKAIVEQLGNTYPGWLKDYQTSDQGANERRVKGLTLIASDKRIAQRPEIKELRTYLSARQAFVQLLSQREVKSLDAVSNQDLSAAWDQVKGLLLSQSDGAVQFHDLYYRYLDQDKLVGK